MFFKSWKDSNIVNIGQLRFINGSVDEQFIYIKVRDKRNILCEVLKIKQVLSKYKDVIGNHEPYNDYDIEMVYQK